jgi:hypothetical protein
VAAHYWENVVGEGTAREAVAVLGLKGHETSTAAKTARLWRGVKGQERTSREKNFLGTRIARRPQRSALRAKVREGTENQ